jgi:hypothetical protein
MIGQLSGLDPAHLGLIARTSVMHYKHSEQRLERIGRELGVQYVLEGSVRCGPGSMTAISAVCSSCKVKLPGKSRVKFNSPWASRKELTRPARFLYPPRPSRATTCI